MLKRLVVPLLATVLCAAQVVTAQTTDLRLHESLGGGTVTGTGGVFTLDESNGLRPQGGLDRFHLFETFDLGAGDTVEWVSTLPSTRNIFNLVTGGGPSEINGLLRSTLDADLYIINPDGILFDENSSLDLAGSFIASSADRISFANGSDVDLDGVDQTQINALLVSPFESFGFLGSEESIEIRGAELSVGDDQTLGFYAGRTIRIENSADDTAAELNAGRLDFYADRGNVRFDNAVVTATSGNPEGGSGISIEARRAIRLSGAASLTSTGALDSLGIVLKADEVTLQDIGTRIESIATVASGGAIDIDADELLSVTNGASVITRASGTGSAARIELAAEDLLVLDGQIETFSTSAGAGQGEIDIDVKQVVNLMNGRISSDVPVPDAGEVRIDAPLVVMQDRSELNADPVNGAIRVDADLVVRSEESRISAGSVSLTAVEVIHSLQSDLNERLEILPHDFYGKRVRLQQHCAASTGERKGSLILEPPQSAPDDPARLRGATYASPAAPSIDPDQNAWNDLLHWFDSLVNPTPNDWLAHAEQSEANGLIDSALDAAEGGLAAGTDSATLSGLHAVRGRLLSRVGRFNESRAHFDSALALASGAESESLFGNVQLDRGISLAREGEWTLALDAFEQAIEFGMRAAERHTVAAARVDRASVLIEIGEYDQAREALLAMHAFSGLDTAAEMQVALHGALALLRLADAKPSEAGDLRKRAVDRIVDVARIAEATGRQQISSFAWGFLAQVYAEEGFYDQAVELTQWAIEASLAATDRGADLYRWQSQLGDIWMSIGDFAQADRAYETAINATGPLSASSGTGLTRLGPFDEGENLAPVTSRQVDAILQRASLETSDTERRYLLGRALARVESQRVQELQDYFQDPCISAEHKQSATTVPHTLVVHPVPLDDRLALIVSSPERIATYSVPVSSEQLFDTLRTTSVQLRDRTTNRYLKGSSQLYDWLIRPIEHEFTANGIRTLVFVSGPVVRSFPMAALFDRESSEFLVEKIAIASTQGLSLTEPRPLKKRDLYVLRAGLTEKTQGAPALRFARKELDNLAALFPGKELVDAKFDRAGIEEQFENESFDIVHIASHGAFEKSTGTGYVLTAKERLGFEDLASIIRKTRFRDRPTELITLSACETAVGGEDAVLGLAGLSLRAGARSTLATLWRVNDAATAELMDAFYRHLAEGRESRAGALRKAQQSVLENPVLRHPSYWAPFTLLGSWL